MAIVAKNNKPDYTPAPEGLWPAVCVDVVDVGMQPSPWGDNHKVEVRWQLGEEAKRNGETRPMVVQRYTLSLHEKSNLRPMLEAWRGRRFSAEELDGFDLEKLIGANCQVQVIHVPKSDGGIFAKVQAVVPPAKGVAKLRASEDYVRVIDRVRRAELERHPDGGEITNDDIPF